MRHAAILTSSAALALAACSGGGGVTRAGPAISDAENATRVYAEGLGDVGDALTAGQTLTARSVGTAPIELNFGGGDTALIDRAEPSATVRRNANGELTISVNGVEHAFTAADRDGPGGYFFEDTATGEVYSVNTQTGDIDDFLTPGNGYAEVLQLFWEEADPDTPERTYAVFGTETRDDDLAALPSATYDGRARMDLYPTTNFINSSTSRSVLRSDITLNADFGAGEISGSMTGITIAPPGGSDAAVAGSIAMGSAPFHVNAFRGTLTPDAAFTAGSGLTNLDAQYSGAFYGPAAEEVSGVIMGTGTLNGVDVNSNGYFHADTYP